VLNRIFESIIGDAEEFLDRIKRGLGELKRCGIASEFFNTLSGDGEGMAQSFERASGSRFTIGR
jgi:hypothetical protein